ncbi:6639_t:CDS:2 [Racocetra fulgida]|uniref:6639_t:CDS:1 n=1 Tax=Racocetra fulgida TaxID=60492 RepID=A0A9N9ATT9_9GLOM|nr:6639_t:CDS:2 [Racocetra fulgida]
MNEAKGLTTLPSTNIYMKLTRKEYATSKNKNINLRVYDCKRSKHSLDYITSANNYKINGSEELENSIRDILFRLMILLRQEPNEVKTIINNIMIEFRPRTNLILMLRSIIVFFMKLNYQMTKLPTAAINKLVKSIWNDELDPQDKIDFETMFVATKREVFGQHVKQKQYDSIIKF